MAGKVQSDHTSGFANAGEEGERQASTPGLKIGWAQADITPKQAVLIAGQFHARLSEGVIDPLTVTVCALESGEEQVVFVSCDIVTVPDELRDGIRDSLRKHVGGPDPLKVVLNATHTHTGPEVRLPSKDAANVSSGNVGVQLGNMSVQDYTAFAAGRIVEAVMKAWHSRRNGGMSFGQGTAVVGRNRRWVNSERKTTMYGLTSSVSDSFRHIEGYEDHSLDIVATYDKNLGLTGLIVNIPCPAQEIEGEFSLSADWWHETRSELRSRFGEHLYILAQCSAAGDQSPHLIYDHRANERMLRLAGRTMRQEIAHRIGRAIADVLPVIGKAIEFAPVLRHSVETVKLAINPLTEDDVRLAEENAEKWKKRYEDEKMKLESWPGNSKHSRWYVEVTEAYNRMKWYSGVIRRYEQQKTNPYCYVELHILQIGGLVIATNPFEYYLDFGVQVKVRSPSVQTMLVQLTGPGTYVPSPRSVTGGGYGSVSASNRIGTEGGQQLADYTVHAIRRIWSEQPND